MPRAPSPHPTDVELEILQALWNHGPCSLSLLCETLRTEREVAATTVATMLRVMSDKNLVKRTGSGRGATWSAVVTQQRTEAGMVGALVDRLFAGAADRLAAHLVEGGQLNPAQLAELRQLIDQQSSSTDKKIATTKTRRRKDDH
ncbi:BlaI/MecI/CopY family transcriptional regulator [Lacipirellula sp.]|uniref:BlaI/MecI/CopY family transcriptional regulator n=1 Tax=Lacipirellula sp. TaxID=2691419 RepID=UPI003D0A0D0A